MSRHSYYLQKSKKAEELRVSSDGKWTRAGVGNSSLKRDPTIFEEIEALGAGIYILQPRFSTTLFKIGKASNLHKRLDSYCGYYPEGFAIFCLVETNKTGVSKAEREIQHLALTVQGITGVVATCGKRKKNTEWIQCTRETLNALIKILKARFGDAVVYPS